MTSVPADRNSALRQQPICDCDKPSDEIATAHRPWCAVTFAEHVASAVAAAQRETANAIAERIEAEGIVSGCDCLRCDVIARCAGLAREVGADA